MSTWRTLGLPSRTELWRQLRSLRAAPPGAAARSTDRARTFQAALEQAQQLMGAAESAGYASRPLQLFYALSQGGRAITAASPRLTTPWTFTGHGISAEGLSNGTVAGVSVFGTESGLLRGVAAGLGVEALSASARLSIGDLWPCLPESVDVPLPGSSELRSLTLETPGDPPQTSTGSFTTAISYLPRALRDRHSQDPDALHCFLSHYPTLSGWSTPAGAAVGWRLHERTGTSGITLTWPHPHEGSPEFSARPGDLRAHAYWHEDDLWVFPRVAGMTSAIHPLVAWWAVLFGLSMLARYEPRSWAAICDIDSSVEANAVEHILDQALDVVPALLVQSIRPFT